MKILFTFIILFFTLEGYAREVSFSWAPLAGATKYEIQVATDQKFVKPLVTGDTEKPEFTADIAFGQYFYRVRVHDNRGKPGRWSQPQPVLIGPYTPELISPEDGYQTSYYEILPSIDFSWKPIPGVSNYEVLITKDTGQKVLELNATEAHISTDKIPEGNYSWKVRAEVGKALISPYGDGRKFVVIKKPLEFPKLITPAKNGLLPAYRSVEFSWTKDEHAPFTDLYYEKVKGRSSAPPFKKKITDLKEIKYIDEYQEPGEYKWSVVTREGKDTPGVTSEVYPFEVRDDVLVRGNYELEFSLSPTGDLYTTNSFRQTSGVTAVAQQSSSSGVFAGFLGGYYFLENLGIYLSTRTGQFTVENLNAMSQESDVTFRLRFGTKGFNQEFWLGYRAMDIIEAENTPAVQTTDFTAIGPIIGTRLNPTIKPGLKLMFDAYYFKPVSNMEGIGNLTADVYGIALGLKWNFMYQFWLGYRLKVDRINASFITPGQGPGVNSGWTMYRTEPLFISLSFEH
jgi:hypothetical protein